ncbi:anti-sigma-F factor Fin [Filobacillus milosensis]|uniref:anti-sigma-F factor Fin n=1 Tax=Filobacillus milosensis TaxID=94137 RepID=UPI001891D54A|nr:anti-sigma-F factor Fin [Filobacillus milosensis]
MAVNMKCRHCQQSMGVIEDEDRVYDLIGQQPFALDIVQLNDEGEVSVQLICEHCEEILAQNPNLFENDTFIH